MKYTEVIIDMKEYKKSKTQKSTLETNRGKMSGEHWMNLGTEMK